MIISVDTEKMLTISNLANQINAELEACANILMPVVEHNDWNCKERYAINDAINAIKSNSNILFDGIGDFAKSIVKVTDMFNEFEASIPNKYQHLDAVLGSMFAIETPVTTSPSTSGITTDVVGTISQNIHTIGGLENNALGNLTNEIQLCKFEDVDLFD